MYPFLPIKPFPTSCNMNILYCQNVDFRKFLHELLLKRDTENSWNYSGVVIFRRRLLPFFKCKKESQPILIVHFGNVLNQTGLDEQMRPYLLVPPWGTRCMGHTGCLRSREWTEKIWWQTFNAGPNFAGGGPRQTLRMDHHALILFIGAVDHIKDQRIG